MIRIVIAAALCGALFACAAVRVPDDLPAASFEQASLYRLEVALLVFYGSLLLVTPAFSGLVRGRLPTEISTRGARFAEEADQSAERSEASVKVLERSVSVLADELEEAMAELTLSRKRGDGR